MDDLYFFYEELLLEQVASDLIFWNWFLKNIHALSNCKVSEKLMIRCPDIAWRTYGHMNRQGSTYRSACGETNNHDLANLLLEQRVWELLLHHYYPHQTILLFWLEQLILNNWKWSIFRAFSKRIWDILEKTRIYMFFFL